jgi:hypothetical protein
MITYGLIFWVNSTNSIEIFELQKSVVRLMVGAINRVLGKNI